MIQWTSQTEQAFMALKKALITVSILQNLDFNLPYVVQMNALEMGLGAVLSQVIEVEKHSVLYISCKLLPAQQNYTGLLSFSLQFLINNYLVCTVW